jgi:hypothetical protein
MILDTTSIKLEAVLAGAVSANQPEVNVTYITYGLDGVPSKPAITRTALNSSTDVTILAAPGAQGAVREPQFISIYNKDTASVTVTVKTDDGTTERIICKATLLTLEVLMYEKSNGWYALTSSGGFKQGSGVSVPSSSTDNAVVRWDGAGGSTLQNSSFVVDDSGHVTSFGGNIVFPSSQSASAGANTLDDYEEGTWTPAVTFGGGATGVTYSDQSGAYTKIGRCVTYRFNINLSSKGSSTGSAEITGLPFANGSSSYIPGSILCNALAAGSTTQIVCDVVGSDSKLRTGRYSAGSFSALADTDFTNSTLFETSGLYYT